MASVSESISSLSVERRKLLKLLLEINGGAVQRDAIPKRIDLRPVPLSFSQQRIWFLDQLEPESPFYNLPCTLHLMGRLNVNALRRALDEIVRRHEALRTTFSTENGLPVQAVAPTFNQPLWLVDLQELPERWQETKVNSLRLEEARRPFDLAQDPMLRATLLCLASNDHLLLLTMHHIASDGWSVGILRKELTILYGAYCRGVDSPLPDLPIQYADFTLWQREWFCGERLELQLAYWRAQLTDLPVLELPTDRPRPAAQSYRGARQMFTLPADLGAGLKSLCRREGVTLYMALLAAFQVLLARYSGQSDIAVGTAIAGRNRAETMPLIGSFANTMVMRTDLAGEQTFIELLRRVKEVCLGAYRNQDLPFEKLVEDLQPARDLARSPLFQVMFILQNAPGEQLEFPGIKLSALGSETRTAKLDLLLSVFEVQEGLRTSWEYNTDLYEAETIARMAQHYQIVLTAMIEQVGQIGGRVGLLSKREQAQLAEWNETRQAYQDRTMVELFEAHARERGDAVAVENGCGKRLTYRELNDRTNRLARWLIAQGVGPEEAVGVCIDRGVELIEALLGVLKAGGAYLPLETRSPAQRLKMMVEDAGVRLILTQEHLREMLSITPARLYCIEREELWQTQYGGENIKPVACADNLAYVIYTSGSTGGPKGVMVQHRNVAALLAALPPRLAIDVSDVWTMCHSFAFDFSVWELWGALLTGGRLLIVPPAILNEPARFLQLLGESQVTVLSLTPSAMARLVHEVGPNALISGAMTLRHLVVGGEAMPRELAIELLETGLAVWNFYGPTETTVWVAIHRVVNIERTVPIGRPINNSQLYILDRERQQVPIGVVGELYIGGANLSRGYLNQSELTAEKFTPHPFIEEPGARLYWTGDLARYLPNGDIEFLGRLDQQVKIRGYRIETGEIEAVLTQHPGIRDSLVVAREDNPGERRLVAYIVPSIQPPPSVSELHLMLKDRLPEYMVPRAWVVMDHIPLTTNGKVDRRALPAPGNSRPELLNGYIPPRTPVEEMLGGIWRELLRVERIGVHDNFFELGGHSLLATQVISRVREQFNVEVLLRSFFESPTISGLAHRVEHMLRAAATVQMPPLVRLDRGQELPLSFAQQRLWFLAQLEPNSSAYNIPTSVRLTGRLNVNALRLALNEIVRRHGTLRTTFTSVNGRPVQLISPSLALNLATVDLQSLPESIRVAEVEQLTSIEARRPFDLIHGPLLRLSLLRLDVEDHVVLLTMHHIVSDGWSMGVLIREVATLYDAFATGGPSPLSDLTIQYSDFAVWQREWLKGDQLETQLAYWRGQLAGKLPVLSLPIDRPRSSAHRHRGAQETLTLPIVLRDSLKQLSDREGVTLFMTMLAAFYILLSRYSGQEDIIVGTDIANRNRAETEDLIGFFVNQLVMRADLSGNPPFREFLKRVRTLTLMAYAHQDLPFEKLVETINPDRAVSRTPLFQVKIVLQNAPAGQFELRGLRLQLLSAGSGTGLVKFDLQLNLVYTEQGLRCELDYSTDLFESATIARLLKNYQSLLGHIAAQPDAPLAELEIFTEAEREEQNAEKRKREEAKLQRFKSIKPKAIKLPQAELVNIDCIRPGELLPLLIQPTTGDIDLAEWVRNNLETIEPLLLKHGGILFRGFNIHTQMEFERFLAATSVKLTHYHESATPRTKLGDKIYTSTEYPPDEAIALHNELTYMMAWPMKIWFCCLQPAEQRGQTPIADTRKVYQRIDPKIRERFNERGWALVRNFGDGFSLPWQETFHTTERSEVERYCRGARIEYEWKDHNRLRTRQVRPAFAQHPKTGEVVWFNHIAFWHVSSLKPEIRDPMLSMLTQEGLPYNTYYGDGSPIESSVITEIREAYASATIEFDWQRGDVLMLDNMLASHGRNPFIGSRKVVVAMGEAHTRAEIQDGLFHA